MTAPEKKQCNESRKSNTLYVYNKRTKHCRKRCSEKKRRRPKRATCVLKCKYPESRTCKRSPKKQVVENSSTLFF